MEMEIPMDDESRPDCSQQLEESRIRLTVLTKKNTELSAAQAQLTESAAIEREKAAQSIAALEERAAVLEASLQQRNAELMAARSESAAAIEDLEERLTDADRAAGQAQEALEAQAVESAAEIRALEVADVALRALWCFMTLTDRHCVARTKWRGSSLNSSPLWSPRQNLQGHAGWPSLRAPRKPSGCKATTRSSSFPRR